MEFYFRRSYRGGLRAVILDWAGTTIDYGSLAPLSAFLRVFKDRGIEITPEEVRLFMGTHKRDHLEHILNLPHVGDLWRSRFNKTWDDDDLEALFGALVPAQIESIKRNSEIIKTTPETINVFKKRGLKIGTTTGYTKAMMEVVVPLARIQGYEPDNVICADDVPRARPAPFMCFESIKNLQVFPLESTVKIGDTPADIEEGLNASMWTIGLARTGNEFGLSLKEDLALSNEARNERLIMARARLLKAGAHFVVDSIEETLPLIDEINTRLCRGERP